MKWLILLLLPIPLFAQAGAAESIPIDWKNLTASGTVIFLLAYMILKANPQMLAEFRNELRAERDIAEKQRETFNNALQIIADKSAEIRRELHNYHTAEMREQRTQFKELAVQGYESIDNLTHVVEGLREDLRHTKEPE